MYNLAMQKIIEEKSVKWALIVQFIIGTILCLIAILFTRTRRSVVYAGNDTSFQILDKQLFIKFSVWLVYGWVTFTMFGYIILLYALSAFTQSLGYSAKQGSYVSCMVSVGCVVGRPAIGFVADRYGPISVGLIVHLIVAVLCWAMWIPCRNLATAIAFALLEGALMGTIWPILGSIIARVVGLRKLDSAFGVMWLFVAISAMPAPVIGLQLRSNDSHGGGQYVNTAIFAGFGYFGAAVCLLMLRAYIIARDRKSGQGNEMDNNELHVNVTFVEFIRGLFILRATQRKV